MRMHGDDDDRDDVNGGDDDVVGGGGGDDGDDGDALAPAWAHAPFNINTHLHAVYIRIESICTRTKAQKSFLRI